MQQTGELKLKHIKWILIFFSYIRMNFILREKLEKTYIFEGSWKEFLWKGRQISTETLNNSIIKILNTKL